MRALCLLVLCVACAPAEGPIADAGELDAGEVDAGEVDAGEVDAGEVDAGEVDAGEVDAGEVDAGEAPDSCEVDGVPGTCSPLSACSSGFTRPEGCAGGARIQCCLEHDLDTPRCPETRTPTVNDGFTSEPAGMGGCPAGMAKVGTSCVDRWEASLVEEVEGVVRSWSPYRKPGNAAVRAVSVPEAYPQGYVTQVQAAAACGRSGKRLCTDEEWLRACRGASERTFPYGNTRVAGACQDESTRTAHPAVACFGSSEPGVFSHLDDPGIDQAPNALAPCGSAPACVSEDGLFDLVGNLHEWTADPAGTFRGGFFFDTRINGAGCAYKTTAHDVNHADYSTGFRCCADGP